MTEWTREQVMALAPDTSAAKAGQGLATAGKWAERGRSARAAWGLCKGSGSKPYQTRIDLSGPAFKCSCPSRKFPCKHALGLFLMLAEGSVGEADVPGWVAEWLESREQRQERQASKQAEAAAKPADPKAQAKRAAQRERRVADGAAMAERWLLDLIGEGLAAARERPHAAWEQAAGQLVDAQCGGLAGMVRRIALACAGGDGWERRTLDEAARMYLLVRAVQRMDDLDEALRAEVRAQIGFAVGKEEVIEGGERLEDAWLVVGQSRENEGRLRVQRTWLWAAKANRPALVLDFAAGKAPLDCSLMPGGCFGGTLAFCPGAPALRALVVERGESAPAVLSVSGDATFGAALERAGRMAAEGPWIDRLPMLVRSVRPGRVGDGWGLVDCEEEAVPLAHSFRDVWRLLALSGGHPMHIFGEWSPAGLLPLGAQREEAFCAFGRGAA